MKDRWRRHYEGRKKRSHFYSGEACMNQERSQCVCEAHLQKQFRKPTLYDHKYLQIWQINLTKVEILLFKTNAQNKNVKYTPSKV
jgi:hypothetical protein